MKREPVRGAHEIEVLDNKRQQVTVRASVKFCRITVHPPIGKHKQYPPLSLTVIYVRELGTPVGRSRLYWKLLTDLPVEDLASAIEKIEWYAQRWKIETFHKVLKSGCQAERSKLRTAERLTNLIAILCIIGWRVFWLTMVNRTHRRASGKKVFTDTEVEILNHLAGDAKTPTKPSITHCIVLVAKLGGYLARKGDPPPGNMVLWRGLSRLTDIHLGVELSRKLVGN